MCFVEFLLYLIYLNFFRVIKYINFEIITFELKYEQLLSL